MTQRISCGDVTFYVKGENACLIGEPRVAALRTFYLRGDMGALVAHGDRYAPVELRRPLVWSDIDWSTVFSPKDREKLDAVKAAGLEFSSWTEIADVTEVV